MEASIAEVLSLPVHLLAELPLPCTLTVSIEGLEAMVMLTTSRDRVRALASAPVACLTPVEYEALALALADGRVTRADTRQELARKAQTARQGREHRLSRERLLGPVRAPDARGGLVDGLERRGTQEGTEAQGEAWTFGMLLEALGAVLEGVRVEDGGARG